MHEMNTPEILPAPAPKRPNRVSGTLRIRRALDFFFYRLIAGYFVRPLRPLIVLILIAAGIAMFRVMTVGQQVSEERQRGGQRIAREFLDALALVGPGHREPVENARRLEAFVYRVLVVCALIGLANSNPTLRQMFDALL